MPERREPARIVAINRSADVLALLDELLTGEGYQVFTHRWTDLTLPIIVADQPDLVIIDYQWATEDDHWSMLQMLRLARETAKIPIVLCTGAVSHVRETETHLAEMGVDVVLKPFDIDHLLEVIARSLDTERARRVADDGRLR